VDRLFVCLVEVSPPTLLAESLVSSLVDGLPAVTLAASFVFCTHWYLARPAARCIAYFFHSSTSCPPPRCWLHRLFVLLVNVLPAASLAASLVSFLRRRLACRATHCVAHFSWLSTSCPLRCLLDRLFLSLVDLFSAAPLRRSLDLSSLLHRRLVRRAAHCNACLFRLSMSCLPRCWLHRLFVLLVDVLPAVPLAASLLSFLRRRLACRATHCVARFFLVVEVLPASRLAGSLAYFTCLPLPPHATHWIACLFHLWTSCPSCRSLYRLFLSLVNGMPPTPLVGLLVSFVGQHTCLLIAKSFDGISLTLLTNQY
jgi:hypothetical protein